MTKLIVRDRGKGAGRKAAKSSISEKRVIGPDGRVIKITTVDANSASFSSDLTSVFAKNVARARRENKKKFGSPDRVSK